MQLKRKSHKSQIRVIFESHLSQKYPKSKYNPSLQEEEEWMNEKISYDRFWVKEMV